MPEHRHVEMRRTAHEERRRRRVVITASAVGGVALLLALGAIIVGTFPKPDLPGTALTSTGIRPATIATVAPATLPKAWSANSAAKPKAKKATGAAKPAVTAAAQPIPPLGMASTLPGSTELLVATGAKLGATTGKLRIYDLVGNAWKQAFSAPCRFGTYGLVDGTARKEGSRTTPTGIWQAGKFVWGWHAAPPAGTKMPYRQTTANIWWSDERGSTYNTWVDSTQAVSGEHLVDARVQYEYAYSTGYNAPPNEVVEGRGTAIFLHVFDPPDYNKGLSAGCVTVSRSNMIRVLQTLDPARRPSFAVGTQAPGTPTSVAAY